MARVDLTCAVSSAVCRARRAHHERVEAPAHQTRARATGFKRARRPIGGVECTYARVQAGCSVGRDGVREASGWIQRRRGEAMAEQN